MPLADLVTPALVLPALGVPDKRALHLALAIAAEPVAALPAARLLAVIEARERLGTTGFGGGVAIPHGRVDALRHPLAVVARLAAPVDYAALDGVPVDLAVLLLWPADDPGGHLRSLARVSRLLRDRATLARLRAARDGGAMHALLTERPDVAA